MDFRLHRFVFPVCILVAGLRAAGAGEAGGTLHVADISIPEHAFESLGMSYVTPPGSSNIIHIEAQGGTRP